jgi:hypothetical protein
LKINEIALDVLKDVSKIVYTFILFYFIRVRRTKDRKRTWGLCCVWRSKRTEQEVEKHLMEKIAQKP